MTYALAPENHCLLELTDQQTAECVYAGPNEGATAWRKVRGRG
jgi:hypothetical protein